jgi:hypothetical protein
MLLLINKSIAQLEAIFLLLVSRMSYAPSSTSPVVTSSASSIQTFHRNFIRRRHAQYIRRNPSSSMANQWGEWQCFVHAVSTNVKDPCGHLCVFLKLRQTTIFFPLYFVVNVTKNLNIPHSGGGQGPILRQGCSAHLPSGVQHASGGQKSGTFFAKRTPQTCALPYLHLCFFSYFVQTRSSQGRA